MGEEVTFMREKNPGVAGFFLLCLQLVHAE